MGVLTHIKKGVLILHSLEKNDKFRKNVRIEINAKHWGEISHNYLDLMVTRWASLVCWALFNGNIWGHVVRLSTNKLTVGWNNVEQLHDILAALLQAQKPSQKRNLYHVDPQWLYEIYSVRTTTSPPAWLTNYVLIGGKSQHAIRNSGNVLGLPDPWTLGTGTFLGRLGFINSTCFGSRIEWRRCGAVSPANDLFDSFIASWMVNIAVWKYNDR